MRRKVENERSAEAVEAGVAVTTYSIGHRCNKRFLRFFIIFIENRVFNVFLELFLFSIGEIFYPTKPVKLLHKTTFKWCI